MNIFTLSDVEYDKEMILRYGNKVIDNTLLLYDCELNTFNFVEQLDVWLVVIWHSNVSFQRSPANIVTLQATDCEITQISGIRNMVQLYQLDLSNNLIVDISELQYLVNVEILDLNYNQIVSIDSLQSLCLLKTLNLNYNQIVDCSSVRTLQNLESLSITNNYLVEIHDLRYLALNALSLHNNKIIDISPLINMVTLNHLQLQFNCVQNISVVQNHPNRIKYKCTEQTTPNPEQILLSYKLNNIKNQINRFGSVQIQWKKIQCKCKNIIEQIKYNLNKIQIQNEKFLNLAINILQQTYLCDQ
ncbi:Chain_A [Hexamita inflata]|uniref:Leucine Rich Repeat Protein n=1 Tax=Hexamita inflata TaxID=28002 RepID=A0AA86NWP2_9EUKA|nr:Chain A [Hexamita inflata]